ncbi:MAG: hypothetical protein K2P53_05050 [Rickettsiales bacterium]|jgi:hypothetical protein|nr:hypothetical protein [Rickettsiales bacterium]
MDFCDKAIHEVALATTKAQYAVNTEEGRAKICFKQVNVSGVRLCTKD